MLAIPAIARGVWGQIYLVGVPDVKLLLAFDRNSTSNHNHARGFCSHRAVPDNTVPPKQSVLYALGMCGEERVKLRFDAYFPATNVIP